MPRHDLDERFMNTGNDIPDKVITMDKVKKQIAPPLNQSNEGGLPPLSEPIISQEDLEEWEKENKSEHEAPFKFFATDKKADSIEALRESYFKETGERSSSTHYASWLEQKIAEYKAYIK